MTIYIEIFKVYIFMFNIIIINKTIIDYQNIFPNLNFNPSKTIVVLHL